MIGIFSKNDQIIIVGLDDDGNVLDKDNVLSMKELNTFNRIDFDPNSGQVLQIQVSTKSKLFVNRILETS